MQITFDKLKQIVPALPKNADAFIPYLNEVISEYKIDTSRRLAGFIAQVAHESGGFRYTTELANGSKYDGRKDLGNVFPGDGPRFKGRGLIQITGRSNYKAVSKAFGIDFEKTPELLAVPQYAVKSAAWKWAEIKGNGLMDLPDTWRSNNQKLTPFQYLTYRVNGGQNGYQDRLEYFKRAMMALS